MLAALAAVELITLHQIDGRAVLVNPAQITQVIHPHETGNKQFPDAVKCVIRLTDGSYVSVEEDCYDVREAVTRGTEK